MSAHARPWPATVSVSPVSRTVPVRPAVGFPRASWDAEVGGIFVWLAPGTSCQTVKVGRAEVYLDYDAGEHLIGVEVLLPDGWERP